MVKHQPSEKECTIQSQPEPETTGEVTKMDKEAESSKVSPACTTSYQFFGCRRSRRTLTEVMIANIFLHRFTYFVSSFS